MGSAGGKFDTWMQLDSLFSVGLLDLNFGGCGGYAERIVVCRVHDHVCWLATVLDPVQAVVGLSLWVMCRWAGTVVREENKKNDLQDTQVQVELSSRGKDDVCQLSLVKTVTGTFARVR